MPEPEVVFDLVGLQHGIADFRRIRQQAQGVAFQRMLASGRKEITLADIYDGMQIPGYNRDELFASELAFERALTRPSAAACALFQYAVAAGKRVVVISDMYLPGDFIAALCKDFGLQPERVFVSSDSNATKRDTGELYLQVATTLGVETGDIAHIGDNYISDVQRAQSRGLTGVHYCPVDIKHRHLAKTPVTSVLEELLRLEVKQHRGTDPLEGAGTYCGAVGLLAFSQWLRSVCTEDTPDLLCLVSRDGHLLNQVFADEPVDVPFAYMHGSRVAYTLAQINEHNFEAHLEFLISGSDYFSVDDYFARIGLPLPSDEAVFAAGLTRDIVITAELHEHVRHLLRLHKKLIVRHAYDTRAGLYRYLLEMGIRDGMRLGFVDIGWSGTTQDAFETAVKSMFDVEVIGYYFCLADTPSRRARAARLQMKALLDPSLCDPAWLAQVYDNRVPIEMFFSAPEGATIGFDAGAHFGERTVLPVKVVKDQCRGINYDIEQVVARINAGSLAGYRKARQLLNTLDVDATAEELAHLFVNIILDPPHFLAASLGWINNFDNWASTANYHICIASPESFPHEGARAKRDMWPAAYRRLSA
ncbi:hypothetical protein WG78_18570 [Amantichitinum ursilacus]|uniref:Uncharacterized protein n=2 Tax=Amantichitinum ursilacus TaxID=857265 RepID=A0A0N0GLK8_9NEIS|nr:hypothetical protein WG78_18570 [Amantichitinum ursilacus]